MYPSPRSACTPFAIRCRRRRDVVDTERKVLYPRHVGSSGARRDRPPGWDRTRAVGSRSTAGSHELERDWSLRCRASGVTPARCTPAGAAMRRLRKSSSSRPRHRRGLGDSTRRQGRGLRANSHKPSRAAAQAGDAACVPEMLLWLVVRVLACGDARDQDAATGLDVAPRAGSAAAPSGTRAPATTSRARSSTRTDAVGARARAGRRPGASSPGTGPTRSPCACSWSGRALALGPVDRPRRAGRLRAGRRHRRGRSAGPGWRSRSRASPSPCCCSGRGGSPAADATTTTPSRIDARAERPTVRIAIGALLLFVADVGDPAPRLRPPGARRPARRAARRRRLRSARWSPHRSTAATGVVGAVGRSSAASRCVGAAARARALDRVIVAAAAARARVAATAWLRGAARAGRVDGIGVDHAPRRRRAGPGAASTTRPTTPTARPSPTPPDDAAATGARRVDRLPAATRARRSRSRPTRTRAGSS